MVTAICFRTAPWLSDDAQFMQLSADPRHVQQGETTVLSVQIKERGAPIPHVVVTFKMQAGDGKFGAEGSDHQTMTSLSGNANAGKAATTVFRAPQAVEINRIKVMSSYTKNSLVIPIAVG